MATGAVTPPPGYTLEDQQQPTPPPGYTIDQGDQQPSAETHGFWSTVGSDIKGAAEGVAETVAEPAVHLKNAVTSLAKGDYEGAAMHFLNSLASDPAAKIIDQQLQSSKQAKDRMMEAAKSGDSLAVAQHAAGMVPGANMVDDAMTKYQQEPSRENLAHVMTTAIPLLLPGAIKGAGAIKEALPSASRAGQALGDIKTAVGDVPLAGGKLGKLSDTVSELMKQDERGAPAPDAVKKLAKRIDSGDPIKYEEAKDFQSNISALSADEKMAMKPQTKRLIGQLNADLKDALEDAADTQGKGEQFVNAMKEYHNAMKLKGWTENAIRAGWKAALAAGGLYGAAKIFGAHEPI